MAWKFHIVAENVRLKIYWVQVFHGTRFEAYNTRQFGHQTDILFRCYIFIYPPAADTGIHSSFIDGDDTIGTKSSENSNGKEHQLVNIRAFNILLQGFSLSPLSFDLNLKSIA